jgi:hypothetical protein
VNSRLERSKILKESLLDFVLDAEGEIAIALEAFSADYLATWSKSQQMAVSQSDLVADMFVTEGKVGDTTPISLFLAEHTDLPKGDRQLIEKWYRAFNGLFAVTNVLPDGFALMNWLTAKHYIVKPNGLQPSGTLDRLQLGEICLTRILPISDSEWTFSGPIQLLGKLGKPKLAVAIGQFKDRFKRHLYGDAPDLLEEAWQSVERYHREFMDFFGASQVTMPGRVLHKKLNEFQDVAVKRRLATAGLDDSQSLNALAAEAGLSQDQIAEAAASLGADQQEARRVLEDQTESPLKASQSAKMVMPEVKLPDALRNADHVTVIVHPRWGQTFLTDYHQLTTQLETLSDAPDSETSDDEAIAPVDSVLKRYLDDSAISVNVWHHLAQQYPMQLEAALRRILDRPDWQLSTDLDPTLASFGKPLIPQLPEIASVPVHLHNLFQEALAEVNSSKSKRKNKAKPKHASGFGR